LAKPKPSPAAPPPDGSIEIGARGLAIGFGLLLLVLVGGWWLLNGRSAGTASAPPPAAMEPPIITSGGQQVSEGSAAAPVSGAGTFLGQSAWLTAEGDPGLGPVAAPVTIEEFTDYQCPNCRQFATEVLPWLAQTWMPTGLVRVVVRDFPIRGPESRSAAVAARCAAAQGRYWDYQAQLFARQSGENKGTFSDANLATLASELGLDEAAFGTCRSAAGTMAAVDASLAAGRAQGFDGTPSYRINGRATSGAIPVDRWHELLGLYAQQFGVMPPVPTPAGG
jgi:protein-disulfide isomerase